MYTVGNRKEDLSSDADAKQLIGYLNLNLFTIKFAYLVAVGDQAASLYHIHT
jgi:hypothetical protein